MLAPFGSRKLAGVVSRRTASPPSSPARELLRLLEEEPALDDELLNLGRWIANYYCAPLGEVLRAMTPLAGDLRRGKIYSLTPSGRDTARQLHLNETGEDAATEVLRMLDVRALSATYLDSESAQGRGGAAVARKEGIRRSGGCRGRARSSAGIGGPAASGVRRARPEQEKLPKAGTRAAVVSGAASRPATTSRIWSRLVAKASAAARALARRELVRLTLEAGREPRRLPFRAPHALNPHQQEAFDRIGAALEAKQFQTFLLQGVTGSGKTEVYLQRDQKRARAGTRGADAGAGNRVDARRGGAVSPSIRRTRGDPAFRVSRFRTRAGVAEDPVGPSAGGGRDAIRRLRAGAESGPDHRRRGARPELQAAGNAALSRSRRRGRAGARCGAVVVLGSATPSLESRHNAERGKYERLLLPERIESRPMPEVAGDRHAAGVFGDAQAGDVFARADRCGDGATGERRANHAAAEPARIFELRRVPRVRRAAGVRRTVRSR